VAKQFSLGQAERPIIHFLLTDCFLRTRAFQYFRFQTKTQDQCRLDLSNKQSRTTQTPPHKQPPIVLTNPKSQAMSVLTSNSENRVAICSRPTATHLYIKSFDWGLLLFRPAGNPKIHTSCTGVSFWIAVLLILVLRFRSSQHDPTRELRTHGQALSKILLPSQDKLLLFLP